MSGRADDYIRNARGQFAGRMLVVAQGGTDALSATTEQVTLADVLDAVVSGEDSKHPAVQQAEVVMAALQAHAMLNLVDGLSDHDWQTIDSIRDGKIDRSQLDSLLAADRETIHPAIRTALAMFPTTEAATWGIHDRDWRVQAAAMYNTEIDQELVAQMMLDGKISDSAIAFFILDGFALFPGRLVDAA